MKPWLARLHHDLLKPVLWCVRDLRDGGRLEDGVPLDAAELRLLRRSLLELYDGEGRRVTASVLWHELREGSPAAPAALEAFAAAVAEAEAAAVAGPAAAGHPVAGQSSLLLAAALRLESAFLLLAQQLDR